MANAVYDIGYCDKCDLSVSCQFNPSRGIGQSNSVMYILPSPTNTEYKKGLCTGRNTKILKDFNTEYNFEAYFTTMVKCVTKTILFQHEIDNCFDYLKEEMSIVKPKIIVLVGDIVTKQFIDYKFFKFVVDKPVIINLNNQETILYPIYHSAYKDKIEMNDIYNKSFMNIAKLYKAFVDIHYFNIDLL